MGGDMRQYSEKHEEKVKRILKRVYNKVYKVSNSGAPDFKVGDVTFRDGLIECKTKKEKQKQMTIEKEWFEKLIEEAFYKLKNISAVAVDFGDREGDNYFIIPEDDFIELLYYYKKCKDEERGV